jgi:hypothetical protein
MIDLKIIATLFVAAVACTFISKEEKEIEYKSTRQELRADTIMNQAIELKNQTDSIINVLDTINY